MCLRDTGCVLVCLGTLLGVTGHVVGANKDTKQADASRLISAATEAEIRGNNGRSFALLREAVQIDPENALARWRLGEIQVDRNWVPIEETQRRAAADPLQAEYRERRKAVEGSPQGQLLLARWCRKNKLDEEAQFHWANVLSVDPKNKEALSALDLQYQKGRLVARGQNAQAKEELLKAKRAAEKWAPKIVQWRRAVAGLDADAREAALSQIRSVREADVTPSLEEVTLGRDAHDRRRADECLQIGLAFLEALAKIDGQASTESLARHAVFAPGDQARRSATEKLKPRDQHDYVPMLLGGLGMPIESNYSVMTGPDGSVHYFHSLYREGADSDWSFESRRAAVQRDLGGRHYIYDVKTNTVETSPPTGNFPSEIAKKQRVASRFNSRYASAAAGTEAKVARTNQQIESLNTLIVPVLTATTGKDLGDNPKAWWDWWQKENEYYASDDHPVDRYYYSGTDASYTYGMPSYETRYPVPQPGSYPHSCFTKGTPVWTKTGLRPIETIEPSDLVLAQDVNTGELKYQPVVARTVRPPSPIVKISCKNEQILATKGHPFWITGVGWRMAKEVVNGEMLHGVSGSTVVRKIEPVEDAEAYNLVLADMNTYFVGNHGILVHDNTPRQPTQAIVPGLASK